MALPSIPIENIRSAADSRGAYQLCTSELVLPFSEEVKFGFVTRLHDEVAGLNTATQVVSERRANLLRPILFGGAIVGVLDMVPAFLSFGIRAPQGVAAGLIGPSAAFQGGVATWILGMLLHFFIAFAAATIYCVVGRKLEFLADHWLVCGIFYGTAVFLFMNLVILPLSALHMAGPYELRELIEGILGNMVEIGLPISFGLHKFAK